MPRLSLEILLGVGLLAAVSGYAGPITLPSGDVGCTVTYGSPPAGVSCTLYAGASPITLGGVSLYTTPLNGIGFQGDGSLSESATGQVSVAIPAGTTIDYTYQFSLKDVVNDPNWSLSLAIADEGAAPGPATVIGSSSTITGTYGTTLQSFTDHGSFTTTAATNANDYIEVYYTLSVYGTGGSSTNISVPGNGSIDFTPGALPGVPEPASIGLVGAGLTCLGWKLRRKAARR